MDKIFIKSKLWEFPILVLVLIFALSPVLASEPNSFSNAMKLPIDQLHFPFKLLSTADDISIDDIDDFITGPEFDLVWNATASAPLGYNITRNTTLVTAANESWLGGFIVYNETFSSENESVYLYTCTAWNINYTTVFSSVQVEIDATRPVLMNSTGNFTLKTEDELFIRWNVTDRNPAAYSIEHAVQLGLGNISWATLVQTAWTGEVISYNASAATFSDGIHFFRCNTTDKAGNIKSQTSEVRIWNISLEDIKDFTSGENLALVWNVSAFAPLGYNISRNGALVTAANVSWSGGAISFNQSLLGSHGNDYAYTCTMWNVNYTAISSVVRVHIDLLIPVFASGRTEYLFRTVDQAVLKWGVGDTNPVSYSIEHGQPGGIGGVSWTTRIQTSWTGGEISYNLSAAFIGEGIHYFRCNVTDAAGNAASQTYTVTIVSNVPEEVWGGIFGLKFESETASYLLLAVGILFFFALGIGGWLLLSPRLTLRKQPDSDLQGLEESLRRRINSEKLELSRVFGSQEHRAEQQMSDRIEKAGDHAQKTAKQLKGLLEQSDERIVEFVSASKFGKVFRDILRRWGEIIAQYEGKIEQLVERGRAFAIARKLNDEILILEQQGASEGEIKNYLKDPERQLVEVLNWGHYDILRIAFTSSIALTLVNQHAEQGIAEGISKQSSWSKMTSLQQWQKKREVEAEVIERKGEVDDLVGEVRQELGEFLRRYAHQIRRLWKEKKFAEALTYAQGIIEIGTDFIDQYESRFEDFVNAHLQDEKGEVLAKFQELLPTFKKARKANLNKLKTLQHNYIVKTIEKCAFYHLKKKSPVDYLDVRASLSGIDEIQLATILTRLAKENERLIFDEISQQLRLARPKCIICWTEISLGQASQKCPHCGVQAHQDHWMEWVEQNNVCPTCKKQIKI
ncbi:MAG: hypothetical protein ACXAB4_07355 [Candidatus Hodarchaeales archaeon]|jgi:hypothetical protein